MLTKSDWIYFISIGKPVERIRDVNSSYRDASKRFAERYMLDESFIFYGENANSNVLDIGGIDIKMVSQKTIFHFLRNGTLVEIDDLVSEYFSSLGEEAMESRLFCQYVLMEALISGMAFLDSMNVSREKAASILGELSDPVRFVDSVDKAKDYITRILKVLIEYRNQVSDKKYTEIIDKAREFIKAQYKNDEMSLQTVASYVNVCSPILFSGFFSPL
jgi:two-component system response regulator YesN